MTKKVPKRCKTCRSLSTAGKKGTKYARWCSKYSNETSKIVGHCILKNGYEPKRYKLIITEYVYE